VIGNHEIASHDQNEHDCHILPVTVTCPRPTRTARPPQPGFPSGLYEVLDSRAIQHRPLPHDTSTRIARQPDGLGMFNDTRGSAADSVPSFEMDLYVNNHSGLRHWL
jgi:hypothetical protein